MSRKRIALLVLVDLDPVPGTFSTEQSALDSVHHILEQRIPHYDPRVVLAPALLQPNNR